MKGYYATIEVEETEQANRMADWIHSNVRPESVVDVGCATGLYLKPLREYGIKVAGMEISPEAVSARLIREVYEGDITDSVAIMPTADLAICLEVFEHIPRDKMARSARHLAKIAPILIFSAAQPGQGGTGHINCQPKLFWEGLMAAHGYVRDPYMELSLTRWVAQGRHMGWFTQNVMFLKRKP